jgi:hypothetical protein
MALCRNCGWQDVRPTVELCWPCYDYEHRTGRARPAKVVLAHLARTIARGDT